MNTERLIVRTTCLLAAFASCLLLLPTTVPADEGSPAQPAATESAADETVAILPDLVYGHKDGLALTMDCFRPRHDANGAGVLFMVSGGWFSGWAPPQQMMFLFKPLLDKGYTVFAVRHGSSPKYAIPEIVEDVRRGVRYVRRHAGAHGIDPSRLGVYGLSAGGHLSLMLGTASDEGQADHDDEVLRESNRVAAVVAIFPPTDLRDWVRNPPENLKRFPALKLELDKAEACSPIIHVSPDDPPTLLIHGDKDELVPLAHSENIHAEFNKHQVPNELLVIKGAGHGFQGDDNARVVKALVDWFDKHLAPPPAAAPPAE
jgi:acetyl esterase/lipase